MIRVYKYTIIVISFLMFFTFLLYNAFSNHNNQVYASPNIEIIEVREI